MNRTGRAVVASGRDFEIREYPVPDPAPGTILLRQELAGICGTDLHNWQKGIEGEMLLGHENVGIIDMLATLSKKEIGSYLPLGLMNVFMGFKLIPMKPHILEEDLLITYTSPILVHVLLKRRHLLTLLY